MSTQEDREEGEQDPRGRPNRWWAEQKEAPIPGASFRAVPLPHAGPQAVTAEDILGSEDFCWCGEPLEHDWPGKASGVRHPREKEQAMSHTSQSINKSTLKKYDPKIVEVVASAIEAGCRYKINANSITVWGLNAGASPVTFGTNSSGPDIRRAASWLKRNVTDVERAANRRAHSAQEEEKVEEADVVALAEALNGPEHEVPAHAEAAQEPAEEPASEPVEETPAEPVSTVETAAEWIPYMKRDGMEAFGFERNTVTGLIRCTRCDWTTEKARAIGSHQLTVHEKEKTRERLWGNKEAQEKKADSLRYSTLHHKVTEALDLLVDLVDYKTGGENIEALEKENAELRKQLESQTLLREMYENEKKRADDLQARLELMREALGA